MPIVIKLSAAAALATTLLSAGTQGGEARALKSKFTMTERMEGLRDYFDYDGDGVISLPELSTLLNKMYLGPDEDYWMDTDDYALNMVQFADEDGDRKLDDREFSKAMIAGGLYTSNCYNFHLNQAGGLKFRNDHHGDEEVITPEDLKMSSEDYADWHAKWVFHCRHGDDMSLGPFFAKDWAENIEAIADTDKDGQVTQAEAKRAVYGGKHSSTPFFRKWSNVGDILKKGPNTGFLKPIFNGADSMPTGQFVQALAHWIRDDHGSSFDKAHWKTLDEGNQHSEAKEIELD